MIVECNICDRDIYIYIYTHTVNINIHTLYIHIYDGRMQCNHECSIRTVLGFLSVVKI